MERSVIAPPASTFCSAARVEHGLLAGLPSEDRHELSLARSSLGRDGGASLAQAVSRTVGEPRLIASDAEPISKARARERLAELRYEPRQVSARCRGDDFIELRQQRDHKGNGLAFLVFALGEGKPAPAVNRPQVRWNVLGFADMLLAECDDIGAALSGKK